MKVERKVATTNINQLLLRAIVLYRCEQDGWGLENAQNDWVLLVPPSNDPRRYITDQPRYACIALKTWVPHYAFRTDPEEARLRQIEREQF